MFVIHKEQSAFATAEEAVKHAKILAKILGERRTINTASGEEVATVFPNGQVDLTFFGSEIL